MQWSEMTMAKKIVSVISMVCAVAYIVIVFLDIFNIGEIAQKIGYVLFAVFWTCRGFVKKNKWLAICCYILGALLFLLSLWRIFM